MGCPLTAKATLAWDGLGTVTVQSTVKDPPALRVTLDITIMSAPTPMSGAAEQPDPQEKAVGCGTGHCAGGDMVTVPAVKGT